MSTPEPWGQYTVTAGDLGPNLARYLADLHTYEQTLAELTMYVDEVKTQLKNACMSIKPFIRPVPHSAADLAAYVDAAAPINPVMDEIVRVNAREYLVPAELFGDGKPRKLTFSSNQRLDVKAVRASVPEHLLKDFYVDQTSWKLTVKK